MADTMTENDCDVIVVGAGISGLTAAFNIKKRYPEAKVVVLEGKGIYLLFKFSICYYYRGVK